MTSDITAIDLFCGAGGSSTGLVEAGIAVKSAVNHWQLAIDSHQANHPDTDHDCVDIRAVHPGAYPRTTFLWASPECKNHSLAKGRKRKNLNQLDLWGNTGIDPAEERSRATMREVVEFAEHHHNEFIIVENVVDIRHWQHYPAWLTAMLNAGYRHKALYLNSQFFGVPQSRDRLYVVFWKKGNPAPNLDFRPLAYCPKCEAVVDAVQAWKKPDFQWGRYGKRRQYVYVCSHCNHEVEPAYTPALVAIDWSLPAERIGDRDKPLKAKTLERIKAGLRKFAGHGYLVDLAHNHAGHSGKVHGLDDALPTQTTRQTLAMVAPFVAVLKGELDGIPLDKPLTTIVASASQHGLIMPPFVASLRRDTQARGVDEPLTTIVAGGRQHMLVIPPFLLSYYNLSRPARSVDDPMPTITGNVPSLCIPPFLLSLNHSSDRLNGVDEPMPTVMPHTTPSLAVPPFIATLRQSFQARGVDEPLSTVSAGGNNHALIEPEDLIDDCTFRMLQPHELKRGMAFEDDYIVLGNKRDQVKQIGNAVTPPIARMIAERCLETLV